MILLISHEQDDHAVAVRNLLHQRGGNTRLLDLADFPRHVAVDIRYQGVCPEATLHTPQGLIPLADVRVIWWRRPQPFVLHPEISDPVHQAFSMTECISAMQGLWPLLECWWINDPVCDDMAARKPYQLRVAREVGLEVPRTLISNHPASVRALVDELGTDQIIYKAFYATVEAWRETRRLRDSEVHLLEATRYAPVIFQEYVPARLDLRITIMDGQIFASAVRSQEVDYEVDYRMDLDRVRVEPYSLPSDVRHRLLEFMGRLGLVYGAIDMRVTPDDHYVFLEVNTSGQWLFMEEKTGQPMTSTFVDILMAHDSSANASPRLAMAG